MTVPRVDFSILIPVFNREALLGRAIESCLRQDAEGFEVIIVDDASTDGSRHVVKRYSDSRVRLVCHNTNRGVCPARNTGVSVARGEWIVFLDSDDELLPGALARIKARVAQLPADVGRAFFMYQIDSGGLSPVPHLEEGLLDYHGFIRWCGQLVGPTDVFIVTRRVTFESVSLPDSRATEALYHLDFARRFCTQTFQDVVALVHTDAEQRYSSASASSLLRDAPDEASAREQSLKRHGESVRSIAPSFYQRMVAKTACYCFLAGRRKEGFRYVLEGLALSPASTELWALLGLGLFSPRMLAAAVARRRRRILSPGAGDGPERQSSALQDEHPARK
ncbi:MAG: hypothetical protein DDG58_01455 [Ardenticatenia bacterium]|jgi:glycosyltransferase involved in cell wall biosynthesis|nr:MAG: hypothetical protein DDG58_01455 [Ardenticatenia bacterium]